MKVIIRGQKGFEVTIDNGLANERAMIDETHCSEAFDMCMKALMAYGFHMENIIDEAYEFYKERNPDDADGSYII